MDFKTFFVKKIVLGFFISFTCISIAMLVVGLIYEPDATFGYDLFFITTFIQFSGSYPFFYSLCQSRVISEGDHH